MGRGKSKRDGKKEWKAAEWNEERETYDQKLLKYAKPILEHDPKATISTKNIKDYDSAFLPFNSQTIQNKIVQLRKKIQKGGTISPILLDDGGNIYR